MDQHNNQHNTPLHWGYTGTPAQNTWVPPPLKKRALSDSDCDDVYSEESSKEQYDMISPDRSSTGENDSCQMMSRKRRRGVIEKKRRDKINSSLSELKRLVPTAYEKQGSAKLEKAEILQLTVDHLKGLHSKGMSQKFLFFVIRKFTSGPTRPYIHEIVILNFFFVKETKFINEC